MKGPLSFFPNDRAKDVDPLTIEERGMYFTLMRHQWPSGGPIPMDEVDRLIEKPWLSTREVFRRRFIETGGTISLAWVEEEREKRNLFSEMQSRKGKKGGRPSKKKKLRHNQSLTEQKPGESPRVGKGIGIVGDSSSNEHVREPEIIPSGMSSELFHAIKRWEKYRREKRNTLTPSGREAFVKKCQAWGDRRAIAAIDHSIAQGWTGCFEPHTHGTGQTTDRDERKRMVIEAVAQHHRDNGGEGE